MAEEVSWGSPLLCWLVLYQLQHLTAAPVTEKAEVTEGSEIWQVAATSHSDWRSSPPFLFAKLTLFFKTT